MIIVKKRENEKLQKKLKQKKIEDEKKL